MPGVATLYPLTKCKCGAHDLPLSDPWKVAPPGIHSLRACGTNSEVPWNVPAHNHDPIDCDGRCDPRSRFELNPAHPDYEAALKAEPVLVWPDGHNATPFLVTAEGVVQ